MENVKNLTSDRFKKDFIAWIDFLKSLGYKNEWKVLNAVNYGSCQNRQRVFMVSWLSNKIFEWPTPFIHNNNLKKIINVKQTPFSKNLFNKINQYKISEPTTTKLNIKRSYIFNLTKFNSENYLYYPIGFGPTLTASGANSRLKFILNDKYIREINHIESFKYMGFTENDAIKVASSGLISEKEMIFLAGNSISVEVLEELFKKIILLLQK